MKNLISSSFNKIHPTMALCLSLCLGWGLTGQARSKLSTTTLPSINLQWQEEITTDSRQILVTLKNETNRDFFNEDLKVTVYGKNADEAITCTAKVNLSKGMSISFPVAIKASSKNSDPTFFGIDVPLEKSVGEIESVEVDLGGMHLRTSKNTKPGALS